MFKGQLYQLKRGNKFDQVFIILVTIYISLLVIGYNSCLFQLKIVTKNTLALQFLTSTYCLAKLCNLLGAGSRQRGDQRSA